MKHRIPLLILWITLLLGCMEQVRAQDSIRVAENEILIWNGPGPGSDSLNITQVVTERALVGECTIDRAVENVTQTGIIPFIADNPTGAAVVLCPGGGYSRVVLDKEGTDVAEWLNTLGISAFVVKYRLPMDGHANRQYVPLQDAQRAMRYVRGHADQWNIDPDKIGIFGASAGGHMATTLATKYDEEVYTPIDTLDSISAKPNFMILLYPVVTMETGVTHDGTRINLLGSSPTPEQIEEFSAEKHVTSESPITFMARALDDTAVPEGNCTGLRDALDAEGVSNVLYQYLNGGHGRGICQAVGFDLYNWVNDCERWLAANELGDSVFVLVEPHPDNGTISVFPNPVPALNQLHFDLPDSDELTIHLYDMSGKMVEEKAIGAVRSGVYSFDFSSSNTQSGYLLVELDTGSDSSTHLIFVSGKGGMAP